MQKMKLDPYLALQTKINSKWIKDPTVRAKTVKLLDEYIRVNPYDLQLLVFLDMTPKTQKTKEKINWTFFN